MTDFSFLIPALNEEQYIGACLESIHAHCPEGKSYEILVGDNGSTDDTKFVVEDFAERCLEADVSFHDLRGCTVGGVRNLLAREANGPYYVFLDADTRLTPEWSVFVSSLTERPHSAFVAGSRVVTPPEDKNNYLWRNWFKYLEGNQPKNYVNSGHMIMPAHVFNSLGGFDANLVTGEDVDICHRAVKHGYALYVHPELLVYHDGYPRSTMNFFRRELWHGVGDFRDWSTFLESSPAKAGLVYMLWIFFGPFFMAVDPMLTVPWVASLVLIPLMVSMMREEKFMGKERWHHVYLTAVYLLARGMSFLYRNEKRRFVEYR